LLRVVNFRKAVVAGLAGAAAMEVALRGLALAGIPLADIVHEIAAAEFNRSHLVGTAAALGAHAFVGIMWALFYAYFFWSSLKWPPPLQGLVFAVVPAMLALLVVYPQLTLMQSSEDVVRVSPSVLLGTVTGREVGGILLGHAVYGLVMGALYTRPVGYKVGSMPDVPRRQPVLKRRRAPRMGNGGFMFATGIECSYPTIDNGRWRRDEMESCGHYKRWAEDFELARDIGVSHIRYGPPLHLIFQGPGRYDWSLIDEPMADLEKFGPEPIVDLCHFGAPDWLGNFQNKEIADAFPEYAAAFAERYPWVRFYTPINEMYVCARKSTLDGEWNEQRCDEAAFVNAVFNLAFASVGMTDAVLKHRPDAIFVNSESSEFAQPCCPNPEIEKIAEFENERRFLPLDLIYAHDLSDRMCDYLREHHVTDETFNRFRTRKVPRRSILGLDYYEWNEHLIDRDGCPHSLGELFGWYTIAMQYYRRYEMTMMHTETNQTDASEGSRWLWRQWHNVQLALKNGMPLVGFTWYSLTDQIDWRIGLDRALGVVFPVGLFDLNRDPREVGLSYKHLIDMYCDQPEFRECKPLQELLR
jgi:beta-glucosidase/6-phospho-beta-glucosidase/beta-galactosidase